MQVRASDVCCQESGVQHAYVRLYKAVDVHDPPDARTLC